jgi:hypothetical protein
MAGVVFMAAVFVVSTRPADAGRCCQYAQYCSQEIAVDCMTKGGTPRPGELCAPPAFTTCRAQNVVAGELPPPDSPSGPITRCEHYVAKRFSRLVFDLVSCQRRRARGGLGDDAALQACQDDANTKFLTKTS